jgi:hypothetical protein
MEEDALLLVIFACLQEFVANKGAQQFPASLSKAL